MSHAFRALYLNEATLDALREAQVDVSGAVRVDVQHDVFAGKHRVWVNVNGVCVFRACQVESFAYIDITNEKGKSK